ncbi:hypothetical protein Hanom_Chr01g00042201 [Helianthus anomalus]
MQGPEVVHITWLDQPLHEKRKGPEVEKPTKPTQPDAPLQTVKVTSSTRGSGAAIHKEKPLLHVVRALVALEGLCRSLSSALMILWAIFIIKLTQRRLAAMLPTELHGV